jgi:hypothetical protein
MKHGTPSQVTVVRRIRAGQSHDAERFLSHPKAPCRTTKLLKRRLLLGANATVCGCLTLVRRRNPRYLIFPAAQDILSTSLGFGYPSESGDRIIAYQYLLWRQFGNAIAWR